ncbi:MAG TPA: hypothetical protein VNS09_27820 [Solirubrobacter sp.]|nr:hypothetical protein [Solirubrobacter sp.]
MTSVLALVVRLLPDRDWGRAMLAELAAIDDRRARRRFALGCVRAVVTRPAAWLRLGAIALVGAVPALLFASPGGSSDAFGIGIVTAVVAASLIALAHIGDSTRVARLAGGAGLLWAAALLASGTVRTHPQLAFVLIAAAAAGGARRALDTAFVACLLVFVLSVGIYTALPRLAPDVVPANAADPVRENQIESTDPYVGELLLAGLLAVVLTAAVRGRALTRR